MFDRNFSQNFQVNGDSGIKLQYTHCRLWNLEKNSTVHPAEVLRPDLLPEPEANRIIAEVAKFEEIIARTEKTLEACVLVNYLFVLWLVDYNFN
jgi:arginyl-tRNA synthetase